VRYLATVGIRVIDLYRMFDADKDGTVTRKELVRGLKVGQFIFKKYAIIFHIAIWTLKSSKLFYMVKLSLLRFFFVLVRFQRLGVPLSDHELYQVANRLDRSRNNDISYR